MYTVRWVPSALNRLADVWTQAEDRSAVTAAVQQIDRELRSDPDSRGESRAEGRRVLLIPPLGVLFTVAPERQTVFVVGVWSFKTPGMSRS